MQALKFESTASDQRSARSTSSAISYDDSGLADFLIGRAARNLMLGNRFHWYLMVEVGLEDRIMAKMYGRVVFKFMNKVLEVRTIYTMHQSSIAYLYHLHSLRMARNNAIS